MFELKVDVGKGYRVYLTNKNNRVVILLVGGDKSTQERLPRKWPRRFGMLKTTEFDVAEYLDTEELRKGYLELVVKDGTQAELLRAINAVARARGMTETVKEAGITREGLYKALSPNGNPTFSTVWNILHAIGYTLTPTPLSLPHGSVN